MKYSFIETKRFYSNGKLLTMRKNVDYDLTLENARDVFNSNIEIVRNLYSKVIEGQRYEFVFTVCDEYGVDVCHEVVVFK